MQYSVVNYKTVKENLSLRIDADFFRPDYLKILDEIKNKKHESLKSKDRKIFSGPFGSFLKSESYQESGHPFIRISDIKDVYIEKEGMVYLNDNEFERVKKYQLDVNDIVFSKIGTVGRLSLITEELGKVAISENNIGIKFSKNIDTQNRFYIFVFLLSKYGQKQIFRLSSGNVQPKLNVSDIENLNLPVFSNDFVLKIYQLVLTSQSKYQSSKSLYSQAEQLLLSELGLLDWKQKHELAFVKNFSDAKKSDRFDAEYFQPKYEEIIEAVKKYKGGFDELGNLVKVKKSIEPGSEAYQENGIPFVRVSNLSKFELSDNNQQFISEELYGELKTHQPRQGEILLSKDATPGMAYYLNEESQKMIVSGGILRLKIENKQVLPEYLTLVLNSVIVQKQIERDAGGSIINHWRPDQVKATIIPILKNDKQKEIKEFIEKSFSDRKLSKFLLEIAKRGVEMAIEKNEEEAGKWIDSEVRKLEMKF